jgi:tRNA(Arg) A34 adenosine deaminase TadA
MTEKDKAFMRRAIELSAKTSLVVKAGGVFGTVIVDKHGHVRQSPVRSFRLLLSSES